MKNKVFILLLLIYQFSFSQETDSLVVNQDLKVGLVLSGGGAKGFAHIGVLKVLEEAGVRIDYIGGTSMGAIVGGLYASGYTANQLDSLVRVLNFKKLIRDDLPRRAKTFYEKQDAEKYAITLPFDDFQIGIPSGLSKGQNLYNLLSKLTSHVNNKENFNDLPIPFFCMATNLETGKQKILNKGYLPRAIIASGAIPTLFSPVKINDTLYVDGGVVNNYPVDEMRAMGVDLIIGIDVQDSLKTQNKLNSAFDIFFQISNFRSVEVMKEKSKRTDVYLHPGISHFNLVSFNDKDSILDIGKKDALTLLPTFKKIASQQVKKPILKKVRTEDSLFIKDITINGNTNYTRSYVLGKLKLQTGVKTSYLNFNEGVNNLSATGNFQNIDYRFIEDNDGEKRVIFNLQESNNKMLLRFGLHYDNLLKGAGIVNITRKRLLTNNDVASFDFVLGENMRYNFDYYIDKGYYWSVGLNSRYTGFNKNVFIDFLIPNGIDTLNSQVNFLNLKYGDLTHQFYFETLFKRIFLFRLGGELKWLRYYTNTVGVNPYGEFRTVFEDNNYVSAFGMLKFDTLDNTSFPSNGIFFEGDFHLYLISGESNVDFHQYSIAKAKALFSKSFFNIWSATLTVQGGLKLGGGTTNALDFFIGGFGFKEINNIKPFLGYEPLSLRGDTFLMSSLTLDCKVFNKGHLNLTANIANVGDGLFSSSRWIDRIDYSGFGLGAGWETILGPAKINYSYSPEVKEGQWYVSLGYKF